MGLASCKGLTELNGLDREGNPVEGEEDEFGEPLAAC